MYNEDNYSEMTEDDRAWFFDKFGRFPADENELSDAIEIREEDLRISMAEEQAASDLEE